MPKLKKTKSITTQFGPTKTPPHLIEKKKSGKTQIEQMIEKCRGVSMKSHPAQQFICNVYNVVYTQDFILQSD